MFTRVDLPDLFFAPTSRDIVAKDDGHALKIQANGRPTFDDVDAGVIDRRMCLLASLSPEG